MPVIKNNTTEKLHELRMQIHALLEQYSASVDVVYSCDEDGEGHIVEVFLQIGTQSIEFVM